MRIVWDEQKRRANIAKHGLDFSEVDAFEWADAFIAPSHSRRFKAIGRFGERLIVVVYAPLGREAIAIVGMRPAGKKERQVYERQG